MLPQAEEGDTVVLGKHVSEAAPLKSIEAERAANTQRALSRQASLVGLRLFVGYSSKDWGEKSEISRNNSLWVTWVREGVLSLQSDIGRLLE